MYNELDWR